MRSFGHDNVNILWIELFHCSCVSGLTVFLHVDSEALVEAAGLALVAPRHVHHAAAALLAHVLQVPGRRTHEGIQRR